MFPLVLFEVFDFSKKLYAMGVFACTFSHIKRPGPPSHSTSLTSPFPS